MQPTLTTERLTLRPFTLADAADLQRLAGDARIADTTMSIPHPYPEGAAEAWIATLADSFATRREMVFALVETRSGLLIGTAALLDISEQHARAELGYWVGVDAWSKGFGTEAALRLIQLAHQELGITRIVARCLARNPASARVMEKVGLRREGFFVQDVQKNGRYEDVLFYGLVLPERTEKGRDAERKERHEDRSDSTDDDR